jgi:NAD-dependent SIR2 family protein deacetylase
MGIDWPCTDRRPPHPGFALLKYWGEKMPMGYSVFTSNVDGQFQKAGFAESRIHECHGSIHHLQCLLPCIPDIWSAEAFQPRVDHDNCLLLNKPPACPYCDGMTRPNILMFGDWNWVENRAALQGRAQTTWLKGVRRPVVIELGAGTTISSVRTFGQRVITHHGGRRIRINPREFAVTSPEEMGLAMGALAGLQAIAAVLGREWQPE